MNLAELWGLTEWLEREIKAAGIVQKYEALRDVTRQNASGQAQESIEEQRNALVLGLRAVPIDVLSLEQLEFLDRLNIGLFVGERAVAWIEDVTYKSAVDQAHIAAEMERAITTVNEGLRRSDATRDGLVGLLPPAPEPTEDLAILRVKFAGKTEIRNVVELKRWTNRWHIIGRGLTVAVDGTPEDFRVLGASTGSLIVDFGVQLKLAGGFVALITAGLVVVEKIWGIRKHAQELRHGKLVEEKLTRELDQAAKDAEDAAAAEITLELTAKFRLSADHGDGDKINNLAKAVQEFIAFQRQGGVADLVLPEPPAEPEEGAEPEGDAIKELRALHVSQREVRRLEEQVKQLQLEAAAMADDEDDAAGDVEEASED